MNIRTGEPSDYMADTKRNGKAVKKMSSDFAELKKMISKKG